MAVSAAGTCRLRIDDRILALQSVMPSDPSGHNLRLSLLKASRGGAGLNTDTARLGCQLRLEVSQKDCLLCTGALEESFLGAGHLAALAAFDSDLCFAFSVRRSTREAGMLKLLH